MFGKTSRAFLIYLGILSIAGGVSVYLATSKQGPGVSTDAAMLLATAENLVKGRGLVDYRGFVLTQFPPLYSLILALGSIVFQRDAFTIGWALNIVVFAALIWFSGLCFADSLREEPILAYAAAFVVASSSSLMAISANIASDPLFMLMVLFFLAIMSAYLRTNNVRILALAAVLTVIACFQRYAGLALVITGALIVAYKSRDDLRNLIVRAPAFTLLAGTPIVLWGYLHNAPVNGTVFGGRLPPFAGPNFLAGVEKVLYWFIPLRIINRVGSLPLAGIVLGVLIAALTAIKFKGVIEKLRSPEVFPHLTFLAVYGAVLVFDISYYELKGINTDRIHIILLPSLLVVGLAVAAKLFDAAKARFGTGPVYGITILLFLIWSSYPISKSYEYVHRSMESAEVSPYNSINKGDIRSSTLARYLTSLDVQDKRVYTNGSDSAWFIMHTQIYPIPIIKGEDRVSFLQQLSDQWPGAGNDGYVVWFNSEAYKAYYATPQELSSIAQLQELYADERGTVYYVASR